MKKQKGQIKDMNYDFVSHIDQLPFIAQGEANSKNRSDPKYNQTLPFKTFKLNPTCKLKLK